MPSVSETSKPCIKPAISVSKHSPRDSNRNWSGHCLNDVRISNIPSTCCFLFFLSPLILIIFFLLLLLFFKNLVLVPLYPSLSHPSSSSSSSFYFPYPHPPPITTTPPQFVSLSTRLFLVSFQSFTLFAWNAGAICQST